MKYFCGQRHTGYYKRFLRNDAFITEPMDKLFNKSEVFYWTPECDAAFHLLNEKLLSAPILVFPNWSEEFNVHVDA
jgi:hypothetical protein